MNGQGIRGAIAQGMSARRPDLSPPTYLYSAVPNQLASAEAATVYTWTCPTSGWWRFVAWGPGGSNSNGSGGGAGALVVADRPLSQGQSVQIAVGEGGRGTAPIPSTTVTFPWAETLTAGAGACGTTPGLAGGVAICNPNIGDIGLNGSTGSLSSTGGGVAAPSYGTYFGGGAGAYGTLRGATPGAGAPGASTGSYVGGQGLVLVHQVRLHN